MTGWTMLVACHAQAGELWLTVEEVEADGNRFELVLPATALRDRAEPATLHTTDGDVDLVAEARGLRVGHERHWTATDGATVTLEHVEAPAGAAATTVALDVTGKNGIGGGLTFPLQADRMDPVDQQAKRVEVSIDGLDLDYDEAGCAQLRRSPGRVLFRLVGPQDHGVVISTR